VYYRINVSFKGAHFFDTGESVTNSDHAIRVLFELRKAFSEKDGWKIDVTLWKLRGEPVNLLST